MSKVFKPRRGSTSQVAPFVGEAHEVILNTTTNTLHVMDGLTAGGFPLAKEADLNAFKTSQSTKDAQQDSAISAAQTAANNALVSAVIEDGELVFTYGNGTVKRESLPGGMPLGTLMPYTGKDVPAGFLRADGSTYTGMRSSFPEFYNWVVNSGLTVSLGSYTLVEGSCGFYGLDTSTGTVRMPTLAAGVFGTTVAGQYGQAVQAGLPGITGEWWMANTSGAGYGPWNIQASGAFYGGRDLQYYFAGATQYKSKSIAFDASLSNPIYGRSDTVQPPHVKYPWIISVYNAAVAPSTAQASQFVGLLDGKADKTRVEAIKAYITETWSSGTSWYRKWSDGWIEQGGRIIATTSPQSAYTLTLLVPFSNTDYSFIRTPGGGVTDASGNSMWWLGYTSKTKNSVTMYLEHTEIPYQTWMAYGK